MNIQKACFMATHNSGGDLFIRNQHHTYTLYVAAGSVFRFAGDCDECPAGDEYELDARECVSNDWYLVDEKGQEVRHELDRADGCRRQAERGGVAVGDHLTRCERCGAIVATGNKFGDHMDHHARQDKKEAISDAIERLKKLYPGVKVEETSPGHFRIDPGHRVICDGCSADWTERSESGVYGIETKAFCPDCAPRIEASVKQYGEEDHIYARCPPDKSFADWVREDLR